MDIKTFALTAALAVAAATTATAAPTTSGVENGEFSNGLNNWWARNSTIGTLNGSSAAHLLTGGKLNQFFEVAVSGLYDFGFSFQAGKNNPLSFKLSDYDNGLTLLLGKISGSGDLWNSVSLTKGITYTVSFSGNNAYVDNVSAVTAVPGPEAGAGLGALAMGGAAFWMARRRRETAVA